jgi:hypothetical protein
MPRKTIVAGGKGAEHLQLCRESEGELVVRKTLDVTVEITGVMMRRRGAGSWRCKQLRGSSASREPAGRGRRREYREGTVNVRPGNGVVGSKWFVQLLVWRRMLWSLGDETPMLAKLEPHVHHIGKGAFGRLGLVQERRQGAAVCLYYSTTK